MLTGSQCSKNSSEWQCPFASCIHSAEGAPLVDAKKLEELATAELKARESRKEIFWQAYERYLASDDWARK